MKKRYILAFIGLCTLFLLGISGVACAPEFQIKTPDGLTRAYNLYVPSPIGEGEKLPLLIALHQFSDTARGMENLSGFDLLAESEHFIVAYPQGRFRVWNANQMENPDDVAFIETMINAISSAYPVDESRIYVCGASAGGMMSQFLACKSKRIAAIAPVMGSQPIDAMAGCTPGRAVPVLIIHGDADPVVPYLGGETYAGPGRKPVFMSALETAAFWAENNGCTGDPLEESLPVRVDADPTRVVSLTYPCAKAPVVLYTVRGGGHTWPGRDNWYPEFIVGETSKQLDATRVIWDFFKDKRLDVK